MRKFVCAAVVAVCAVGIAMAEDVQVIITKIAEDGTVTYKKAGKKGGGGGDEMTAKLAKDAKMFKGKATFNKDDKKLTVEKGDAVERAAVNEMITKAAEGKAKGQRAQISVEGGTISQIILLGGGGKKGKGGAQ